MKSAPRGCALSAKHKRSLCGRCCFATRARRGSSQANSYCDRRIILGYITILAVFVIAAFIAIKCREDFYDTFPMTISGMILALYVLAFSQSLLLINWVSLGLLAGIGIYCGSRWQKKGKELALQLKSELLSWKTLLLLGVIIIITFLVKDKVALWWDDVNYWAVDAKALYFNNGFAGKYGNVAPEFGDYPPAIQLFKWFFLHFASSFKEGLMFGAYHCMNLVYALPLLSKLKSKNPLFGLIGLAGVFLLPGIVDGIAQEGTCADVTMGLVYGAFLWAAYDDKGHKEGFYFTRMTLYLCVLVLTKSVGIEWAFFGVVFFLLLYIKRLKEQKISFKIKWKPVFGMCMACLLTEGSWLMFCLLNRRVAKLTGAGVKIALSGDFTLPDNTMIKMGHFLRGFAYYPMHMDNTWGMDLSSLAVFVLVIAVVVLFWKMQILQKWETRRMLLFIVVTALAAYGIIFLGHITIFAGELQYLDDAIMARSIARYGAPFSVGLIYLLMGIYIFSEKKSRVPAYAVCLAFVLFTTSLPGAYQTLYGYRETLQEDIAGRDSMVEADAHTFIEKANALKEKDGALFKTRTLYLRDDKTIHWIKDTYISYAASPIPVVYGGIATDTMIEADMVQRINESHAKYLYADKVEGNPGALFSGMLDGEDFEYETFYKIAEENGALRLVKIQ